MRGILIGETFEDTIREWGNPSFERADGTKIFEMREAIRLDQLFSARKLDPQHEGHLERLIGTVICVRVEGRKLQIFVTEHGWVAVFADAGEKVAPAISFLTKFVCSNLECAHLSPVYQLVDRQIKEFVSF